MSKSSGYEKLSSEKKCFNWNLSHLQVKIEHTIGILKLRFRSLQRLPVRIISTHDIRYLLQWISACVILHKILLASDAWEATEEELAQVLEEEMEMEEYNEEEADRESYKLYMQLNMLQDY